MNKQDVLYKQNEWERKAKKVTDIFIKLNPQFEEMRYSFLWIAYHTLRNDGFNLANKDEKKQFFFNKKIDGKYFIHNGIRKDLLEKIRINSIRAHNFHITSRSIGFQLPNRTIFPLSHKKVNNNIHIDSEDNEINKNYKTLINNNFNDMMRLSDLLIKMFNHNKPIFVLLNEDRTKYNRIIAKVAKQFKIPVFILQHGITPKTKNNQMPFANESFAPLYGDYILTWGKNAEQYLREIGIEKQRIIICGNPQYNIANTKNNRKKELLIIDQQFIGQKREMELSYEPLIAVLNNNNIPYKIYLRMEYNRKYIEGLVNEKNIIKWKKGLINKLIREYSLTLGFYSTSIIESVLNRTPSISFDSMNRGDVMGFSSEYLKCISDVNKLVKTIESMLNNNPKERDVTRDIENHIAYFGDDAAGRIVNSIYEKI